MLTYVRLIVAVAALISAAGISSVGHAQEWSIRTGIAGRLEYTDNYFFVPSGQSAADADGPESALTLSLIPFLAAVRRTEVSDFTALLAVGGNKVWGPPSQDDLSGRFELNGSFRDERSIWSGTASYLRSAGLESVLSDGEIVRARTYTNSSRVGGSYAYTVSEGLSASAIVGAYLSTYDGAEGTDTTTDDRGYDVRGQVRYQVGPGTTVTGSLAYTDYLSNVSRDNIVDAVFGIVYAHSPQLRMSGSLGWYWTETEARRDQPGTPPVTAGDRFRDNGPYFSASLDYAVTERTSAELNLWQGLYPSGVGIVSKNQGVGGALSHRFSDRVTGLAGARYVRTTFPTALVTTYGDKTATGEVGLSYQLAQSWRLDAGYRYTRTKYDADSSRASENVVFINVGYNWPGASLAGWVGHGTETRGLLGTGTLAPPAGVATVPGPASGEATPSIPSIEPQPFDAFTLP